MKRWAVGLLFLSGHLACHAERPPGAVPPLTIASPAAVVADDEAFRASAPPPEPARAFVTPEPHEVTLPNGMRVVLIERHDLPLVALQLLVPRGTDDTKPRVGQLAAEALLRGNRDAFGKTAKQRLEALAVTSWSWASLDSAGLGIQCVADKLEPALAIVAEALAHPTYDARDVETVRSEVLAKLDKDRSVIGTVHGWAVRDALYPVGHPYREAGRDRAADVRAVTRAEIAQFASSHLSPDGMTVVAAGDVTPDALRSQLLAAFGAWRGPKVTRPVPPLPPTPSLARVFLVDRPGAAQAHVSVVAPSIARASEDYPAMLVLARILGGTPSSRLGRNLREQKGLTYWVSAQLSTRHGRGELTSGGAVVKEKAGIAIREITSELARLTTEPVPEAELRAATEGLVGEVPAKYETLASILWSYGEAPVHGLPHDELASRPARVQAVTSDDVMRLAKRLFAPEGLRVVVTADASVVRKDLEGLDLGAVQPLEPAARAP